MTPSVSFEQHLLVRDIKGMAGFAMDLIDIGRMRFNNPHALTKFFIIDQLRRRTQATTFLEAGTYLGTTAARCARVFERVVTIEMDADLALQAALFLRNRRNVKIVHADALHAMPRVIESDHLDRIVVFLDAHAFLGVPPNGHVPEPAVEELEALAPFKSRIRGIIVDDFRNFGAAPGFPPRSSLIAAAEAFCAEGGFEFNVHLDQLIIRRKRDSAFQ
jgi:hypothetical protein